MTDWRYIIDIAHEHNALGRFIEREENDKEPDGPVMDHAEAGKAVAAKLRRHRAYHTHAGTLERIAQTFEAAESTEDYDDALGELYDWGDLTVSGGWPPGKMAWIETHERSKA